MNTSGWIGRALAMAGAAFLAISAVHAASQPLNFSVSSVKGTVTVESGGAKKAASVDDSLKSGDTVVTAASSTSDIAMNAAGRQVSAIHVWESSSFTVVSATLEDDGSVKGQAKLNSGSVSGSFGSATGSSVLVLDAGSSRAEIRGSFLARADGSLYCYDGLIRITRDGQTYNVLPGQYFDPNTTAVLPHNLPKPIFVASSTQPSAEPTQVISPTSTTQPGTPTGGGSIKK